MKVTIITTSGSKSTVNTSASTWGELRSDLGRAGIESNGMKALIKESKLTLDVADAQLPGEDFTLFLFPGKVKSGIDEDVAREIERVKGIMLEDTKKNIGVLNSIQDKLMDPGKKVNIPTPQPIAVEVTKGEVVPSTRKKPVRKTRVKTTVTNSTASDSEMEEFRNAMK